MTTTITKPWYKFQFGKCYKISLQNGEVIKYKNINNNIVEIGGERKTINEVFRGKNIDGSNVVEISCDLL